MFLQTSNLRTQEHYVNSIKKEAYITSNNVKRIIKNSDLTPRKEDPRQQLIELIAQGVIPISELENYEYQKPFKYFNLYNIVEGIENLNFDTLSADESINLNADEDYLSKNFKYPSIRMFSDGFDLKFSKVCNCTDGTTGDYIYTVIVSYIEDLKIIAVKYGAIESGQFEVQHEKYFEIVSDILLWLSIKLKVKLEEYNSMRSFRALRADINASPDEHLNEKNMQVSMLDDQFGRTSFTATERDAMKFLDGLVSLIKDVKDETDKKVLLDYIEEYERNSEMLDISVKFTSQFSNRLHPDAITVGARKVIVGPLTSNLKYLYTRCHVYADSMHIDRERIHYAIKYLSDYPKQVEAETELTG